MDKPLITADLLYALRTIAELKGRLATYDDSLVDLGSIDVCLESIKSAIQLVNLEEEPVVISYEAGSPLNLKDLTKHEEEE